MTAQDLKSAALQYVVGTTSVIGFVGTIIGISALFLFAVTSAEEVVEKDQIVASFERELNHEPPSIPTATRSAVEGDVLYQIINETSWSPETQIEHALASANTSETSADASRVSKLAPVTPIVVLDVDAAL